MANSLFDSYIAKRDRQRSQQNSDVDKIENSSGRDILRKLFDDRACVYSDDFLIELGEAFLIKDGILDKPIRHLNGVTYYFNEDRVYCIDKDNVRFRDCFDEDGKFSRHHIWQSFHPFLKMTTWFKSAPSFAVGSSLQDCLRVFLDTELVHHNTKELSAAEKLVTSIHAPEFERDPENPNRKTFDRIRIVVGLPKYRFSTMDQMKAAINENRKEIGKMVLERIADSKSFQKFGVPVNCLSLSSLLLRRDCALEYIFEPKSQFFSKQAHDTGKESIDSKIARAENHPHNQSDTKHDPPQKAGQDR